MFIGNMTLQYITDQLITYLRLLLFGVAEGVVLVDRRRVAETSLATDQLDNLTKTRPFRAPSTQDRKYAVSCIPSTFRHVLHDADHF